MVTSGIVTLSLVVRSQIQIKEADMEDKIKKDSNIMNLILIITMVTGILEYMKSLEATVGIEVVLVLVMSVHEETYETIIHDDSNK